MEHLNRIEIRGNVGNIRIQETGGNRMARISVATNYSFKSRDGVANIETTWHNVIAWEGRGMPDFEKILKGMPIYVCGRLRTNKYTGADGIERQSFEINASRIELIENNGQMQPASY